MISIPCKRAFLTGRSRASILAGIFVACAVLVMTAHAFPGPILHSLTFHDDFEKGDLSAWAFPFPEDWRILAEGPNHFLHMLRNREPGVPRRPLQFAMFKGPRVGSFELTTRLRREHRSLIIVFNYVDTLHFYYAHLSVDSGVKQEVHNGIFIVNGEPRKRIAGLEAAPALPDTDWHTARIVRDAGTGEIEVLMDDAKQPLFSIQDGTFTCGRVGIGSFDETGDFDDFELKSNDAGCKPGATIRPASTPGSDSPH
jgi:hypothetical protein